jgi:hypothetical protein
LSLSTLFPGAVVFAHVPRGRSGLVGEALGGHPWHGITSLTTPSALAHSTFASRSSLVQEMADGSRCRFGCCCYIGLAITCTAKAQDPTIASQGLDGCSLIHIGKASGSGSIFASVVFSDANHRDLEATCCPACAGSRNRTDGGRLIHVQAAGQDRIDAPVRSELPSLQPLAPSATHP